MGKSTSSLEVGAAPPPPAARVDLEGGEGLQGHTRSAGPAHTDGRGRPGWEAENDGDCPLPHAHGQSSCNVAVSQQVTTAKAGNTSPKVFFEDPSYHFEQYSRLLSII